MRSGPTRRVLTAGLAALAGGCLPRMDPVERANTLVVLKAYGPITLDPAAYATAGEHGIQGQVYESLFALDAAEPEGVAGRLAAVWGMSPDARSLDVRIGTGHRFSDGTPVDAEAVRFSLMRVKTMGRNSSAFVEWMDDVRVIAPDSVRILFKRPYAPALQMLAHPATSIVSAAALARLGSDDKGSAYLAEASAGSGPYRVAAFRANERVVLEPNPYATTAPGIGRVEFRFLPDEGVRRLLLERGDADLTDNVPAAFVDRYRALPGVVIATLGGGTSVSLLTLNTRRGPFRDRELRRAAAAAFNYLGLREQVLKGNAIQLPGYLTPGAPGYVPEPAPERDLPAARRLLARSAYDGRPLKLMISQVGPVAEFVQASLRPAGLDLVLERRAPGAIEAAKQSGDFDMIYDGWATDTLDPTTMFEALFATRSIASGVNGSGFSDPEVDAWIDAALNEPDIVARTALLRAIDLRLQRERPAIPIFCANPVVACRDDLTGVALDPARPTLLPLWKIRRASRP